VVRRFRGLEKLRRSLSDTETVWQANGGYEVFTHSENEAMKECLDMLPEINRILHNETGLQPYSVVEKNYGMNVLPSLIHIEGEASLHSGELIRQLLSRVKDAGVDVIYSTDVINYERSNGKVRIETANGSTWQCDRLILCTNALTRRLADLDVWPNRGQVLLTEPIPGFKLRGNFHLHQGYFYFRDFEGGILLGGGRHLDRQNEQTDSQETTEIIQMALNELLTRTIIPDTNYQVKLRWAGSMAFGEKNEKEPLVEELESGIYVAVRLGGMGVALAPEVAEKLAAIL
jgi:gamma-glutamylputrescine oxidase